MTRERFRLQPLLTHRRRVEEAAQLALAALNGERLRQEQALAQLESSCERLMSDLEGLQSSGELDMAAIELASHAWDSTRARAARQQEALSDLESETEGKREALIHAMRDRKLLEKLKERAQLQAAIEERRRETRESDEVARAQYHLGGRGRQPSWAAKDAPPTSQFRRE